MKRPSLWSAVVVALPALAAGALAAPSVADVTRESTGDRRAALDKMELNAVAGAWEPLTDWTHGAAPKMDGAEKPPVLVVTWASWNRDSTRALGPVQKLADQYSGQGLVVIGVGRVENWAEAVKQLDDQGIKFTLAQDAKGGFRKAMKIDNDPDFYVFDRAGHLRYADITTESVEEAVGEVVKETAAQAADVPALLKQRAEEARRLLGQTSEIRAGKLESLPDIPPGYIPPAPEAYTKLKWPDLNNDLGRELGMIDFNGKKNEPRLILLPQNWQPREPKRDGRVLVIYPWTPDIVASFQPLMSQMDDLQRKYQRDLVVIGLMVPITKLRQSSSGQPLKPEEVERLNKKYEQFIKARTYSHTLASDLNESMLNSLGQMSMTFPVPGAVIVSTDGIIRWVGPTRSPDFKSALDRVLSVDPGIKARREADEKYIRNP